jgi:hypothetical protein
LSRTAEKNSRAHNDAGEKKKVSAIFTRPRRSVSGTVVVVHFEDSYQGMPSGLPYVIEPRNLFPSREQSTAAKAAPCATIHGIAEAMP